MTDIQPQVCAQSKRFYKKTLKVILCYLSVWCTQNGEVTPGNMGALLLSDGKTLLQHCNCQTPLSLIQKGLVSLKLPEQRNIVISV